MQLINRFKKVRATTEQLCNPLTPEDYVVQIAPFTSPAKWHLAHTTWFFETFILKEYATNYTVFDNNFNFLFNSYYNNSGQRINKANRGLLSRPSTDQIYAYRQHVTKATLALLSHKLKEQTTILELLELGINHEEQHQELLLTDLKLMLGCNPLNPVYDTKFQLTNDKNKNTGFIMIK